MTVLADPISEELGVREGTGERLSKGLDEGAGEELGIADRLVVTEIMSMELFPPDCPSIVSNRANSIGTNTIMPTLMMQLYNNYNNSHSLQGYIIETLGSKSYHSLRGYNRNPGL